MVGDRRWISLVLLVSGFALLAGVSLRQCEALEAPGASLHSSGDAKLVRDELHLGDDEDELAELDDDDEEEEEEDDESGFDGMDFDDSFEGDEGFGVGDEEEEDNTQFDEKDVVVLSSGNFSDFVNSNHYVLVEFYAPWCGHCQALAPEYAEAATILKDVAVLAKVDATTNDGLAQEHSVTAYPTLFFYIDGVHKPFKGHNRKDEIVAWVKRKAEPSVISLKFKFDAELVLDTRQATMVVALLNSLEGPEVEEYTSASRQEDDVLFIQTDSAEVAEVFNFPKDIKRPAMVLLKEEPEKVSWFDGLFTRDAIGAFVAKNKLPLVITFNKENSGLIFESPIKKQVILFTNTEDYVKLVPSFREASKALIGKLVFVHVDLDDAEQAKGITEYFGIDGTKPVVMGYETEENGQKFLLETEITAENVKAFGEDFLSEKLRPHLKSDPIPEVNDGDVKVVVGLNLDDIVLDETKDVFLEIYAPWCGHCQALEKTWNKLGKRLKEVDSITIAKMDGTSNEHGRAKPDGFPTLLFYPAGKKSFDPITFDGDRTIKDFVKFLKTEAAIPFAIPKKANNQTVDDISKTVELDIGLESKTKIGESESSPGESLSKSSTEDVFDSRKDEL